MKEQDYDAISNIKESKCFTIFIRQNCCIAVPTPLYVYRDEGTSLSRMELVLH